MPAVGPPPIGGDENGANQIHIFTWAFAVTSILFVAARLYSRVKLTKNLWWDDYLICASLVRPDTESVKSSELIYARLSLLSSQVCGVYTPIEVMHGTCIT